MNTVTWMNAEVHRTDDNWTVTVFHGDVVVYQFETDNETGLVRRIDEHLKRRNYLRDGAYEFVGSSAYFRVAYLTKTTKTTVRAMEVNA